MTPLQKLFTNSIRRVTKPENGIFHRWSIKIKRNARRDSKFYRSVVVGFSVSDSSLHHVDKRHTLQIADNGWVIRIHHIRKWHHKVIHNNKAIINEETAVWLSLSSWGSISHGERRTLSAHSHSALVRCCNKMVGRVFACDTRQLPANKSLTILSPSA